MSITISPIQLLSDNFYEKTMDQCHESSDCFYCVSSLPKNVRNCTAIGANGDYICDSQLIRPPIY